MVSKVSSEARKTHHYLIQGPAVKRVPSFMLNRYLPLLPWQAEGARRSTLPVSPFKNAWLFQATLLHIAPNPNILLTY